jgi:hypothetical protein
MNARTTPAPKPSKPRPKKTSTRTIKFRSLTLTLPPSPPGVILLDLAQLERGADGLFPALRLLLSVLGNEQWTQVRDLIADADDEVIAKAVGDLLRDVLKHYDLAHDVTGAPR